ncbi:MAG: CPBP family intramembrane metalloprotease [Bacteroidales bacterium]|nr:CPBP family intramembrane metalloprotease [Candidatus Cryptobacteroides aphodequi]
MFSNLNYCIPESKGFGGAFEFIAKILVLFLGGTLIGALIVGILTALKVLPAGHELELAELISYPFMFALLIPWAVKRSKRYSAFAEGHPVMPVDAPLGGFAKAAVPVLVVAVATVSMGYMNDALTALLPPMPDNLVEVMKAITQGNLIVNLLCVSVMAPILEELLCRGLVMRGLLARGAKPWVAIVVSALFFALIHMNIWQALNAFLLGALFGYVYLRTGSLKLTMIMHCVNNTLSLILSRIPGFEDAEGWMDIMPAGWYWAAFAAAAVLLAACICYFARKKEC